MWSYARYDGAWLYKWLYVSRRVLNSILDLTGGQWRAATPWEKYDLFSPSQLVLSLQQQYLEETYVYDR